MLNLTLSLHHAHICACFPPLLIFDELICCQTWCHCLCINAWCIAQFIFVGTLRDRNGRHPLDGRTKCIWPTAGFCFEICKDEKTLYIAPKAVYVLLSLSCVRCPYACSFFLILFVFLSPSFLLVMPTVSVCRSPWENSVRGTRCPQEGQDPVPILRWGP